MEESGTLSPVAATTFLFRQVGSRSMAVLIALIIGVAVTDALGVLTLVPLLDGLHRPDGGGSSVGLDTALGFAPSIPVLLVAMVMLAAVRAGLTYGKQIEALKIQVGVVDALRARAFAAILHAEWRWLAERRSSDHASLILTNVARVGLGINQMVNAVALAVVAIGYLAAAFLLAWQLAVSTIALGAAVLMLFAAHRAHAAQFGIALGRANKALQAHLQQAFAGVRVIKAYGAEDAQIAGLHAAIGDLRDQSLRHERMTALDQGIVQVGGAAALALVFAIGHFGLGVALATLLPVLFAFARLAPMLSAFQTSWSVWRHSQPAISEIQTFIAQAEAAREPVAPSMVVPMTVQRDIVLRDIGITYTGRDAAALDAVSLTIGANRTTALYGGSGAGKSTLADVLMGLIAPDRGQILIDGAALDGASRIAWRRSIAYVQQDPFLFHDTIRANILLGRSEGSEPAIEAALRRAGAGFVAQLPQGLDTIVGDVGVRLSGGERQRIALARALIGSPALLILDEATSALDPDHEAQVRQTMQALRGEMTLLFISHRESMRGDADRVVMLHCGRIVSDRNSIVAP